MKALFSSPPLGESSAKDLAFRDKMAARDTRPATSSWQRPPQKDRPHHLVTVMGNVSCNALTNWGIKVNLVFYTRWCRCDSLKSFSLELEDIVLCNISLFRHGGQTLTVVLTPHFSCLAMSKGSLFCSELIAEQRWKLLGYTDSTHCFSSKGYGL